MYRSRVPIIAHRKIRLRRESATMVVISLLGSYSFPVAEGLLDKWRAQALMNHRLVGQTLLARVRLVARESTVGRLSNVRRAALRARHIRPAVVFRPLRGFSEVQ